MAGFGRRYHPDVRDRNYLLAVIAPPPITRPQQKTWRLLWHGDQQETPMCVGYSWHALLRSLPHNQTKPAAAAIYTAAQIVDAEPGEAYEGTTVRAGAKALQGAGKLSAYGWAFTIEDVVNWIAFHGPVVLGTDWYSSMMEPDENGLVEPNGSVIGGHAYIAIGYNDVTKRLLCQNSWGKDWGINGRFAMDYADAETLITEQGEACSPTE